MVCGIGGCEGAVQAGAGAGYVTDGGRNRVVRCRVCSSKHKLPVNTARRGTAPALNLIGYYRANDLVTEIMDTHKKRG